jgi:L-ascorbate metabolism protein UlaG (beta-lactamase superfamily)
MRKTLWLIALVWLVCGPVLATEITITYLGHSCFTLKTEDGLVIMIDPYATYLPYPALPKPADVVLITHGHIDHCPWCFGEKDRVSGNPQLVWPFNEEGRVTEGRWKIMDGLVVQFIEASHETKAGGGQGLVCLFSFEVGGLNFAHLADLGCLLNEEQIEALGNVDVLFIPVGGFATIDAEEAVQVIQQLPTVKVAIPMHYYVEGYCPWKEISRVDDFLTEAQAMWTVRQIGSSQVTVSETTLPDDTEVWVMAFATE